MTKLTFFALTVLLLIACNKHKDVTPPVIEKQIVIKDMGSIPFKINPTSPTELQLLLPYNEALHLNKVLLKEDTTTLQTTIVNVDNSNQAYTAAIQYSFDTSRSYNMLVQSQVINDTIYQYKITAYKPLYANNVHYQKLLELTTLAGNNAYDISPSRKYLFVTDYVNMGFVIKRISLENFAVDTVSTTLNGLMIRAVSDNVLLTAEDTYDNRTLGGDSAALMSYNMKTKQSGFIDWVSESYGRTSRVVNHHIWVTNPQFTSYTTTLINLNDATKKVYPESVSRSAIIREDTYDHIYNLNQILDLNTGNFYTPLPVTDSSLIEYIDSASGFGIVSSYNRVGNNAYNNQLRYYQGQANVYTTDEKSGRNFQLAKLMRIENNVVVQHQSYDYDTTIHIDGYYALDLKRKKSILLQADYAPGLIADFQLADNSIVSVRMDGVYRLSR